ncbi:MAG: T9SS type A sorting domain-containing protein [Bacteroidetes bacterium]|nr:T9SS type A sorting domain-containing protein [Bacteroidota bacterium]
MLSSLRFKKIVFLSIGVLAICFTYQTIQAQSIVGTSVGAITPAQDVYNSTTYSTSGKRPYWSFTAVAGRIYEFNLCTASGCSSNRISIYNAAPSSTSPSGFLTGNGNGNASCNNGAIVFQAPASTTYYVGVSYGTAGAHTCTNFTLKYRYLLSSYTVCAAAVAPAERMNSPVSGCYYNGNDYYITYYPNFLGSNAVKLTFSGFNTESGYDLLYIYNGVGTGGTQVAGSPFSGSTLPPTVTSSDQAYGALTLRFVTDGSTPSCLTGYTAVATCTNNILLPISLTAFNATPERDKVVLTWSTASEQNNDFYTVERSLDNGISFEPIAKIKGAGNSRSTLYYRAVDDSPPSGIIYYRLKQTDFNGTFKYSDNVAVELKSKEISIGQFYPNPTNSSINVDVNAPDRGTLQILISDYTGRIVSEETKNIDEGKSVMSMDMEKYPQGIYIAKIIFNKTGYNQINKIIKQ